MILPKGFRSSQTFPANWRQSRFSAAYFLVWHHSWCTVSFVQIRTSVRSIMEAAPIVVWTSRWVSSATAPTTWGWSGTASAKVRGSHDGAAQCLLTASNLCPDPLNKIVNDLSVDCFNTFRCFVAETPFNCVVLLCRGGRVPGERRVWSAVCERQPRLRLPRGLPDESSNQRV